MQKEKKPVPYNILIIALTAVSLAGTAILYPRLPAAIPYHWGIDGSVQTTGKWIAFLTALLPVAIYYFSILRPKKNQTHPEIVSFCVSILLLAVHWVILFISMR